MGLSVIGRRADFRAIRASRARAVVIGQPLALGLLQRVIVNNVLDVIVNNGHRQPIGIDLQYLITISHYGMLRSGSNRYKIYAVREFAFGEARGGVWSVVGVCYL